jgi:hypothetical protein
MRQLFSFSRDAMERKLQPIVRASLDDDQDHL